VGLSELLGPSGFVGSRSTPLGDTLIPSVLTAVLLDNLVVGRFVVARGELWAFRRHGVAHLLLAGPEVLVDLVRSDDGDKWQYHRAGEKYPAENAVHKDHADEARCAEGHGDRVIADPRGHLLAGPHPGIGDQRGRASTTRLGDGPGMRARLAIGHHVRLRLLADDPEYSVA